MPPSAHSTPPSEFASHQYSKAREWLLIVMRPPCDEAAARSVNADDPCKASAERWILAATILASSMAFIDSTAVNVALPALQSGLHATVVGVQWVVESYGLFLGALILVGGALGDLFGRRLIFLVGVGIFAAASIACGFAADHSAACDRAKCAGCGRCLSRSRQPFDHRRIFRRKNTGPSNRHLVRFHRYHHGCGAGSGRLADRACLMALGFLHQHPIRRGCGRVVALARSRKQKRCRCACGLAGSARRNAGIRRSSLRLRRVHEPRLGTAAGLRKFDRGLRLPDCIRVHRGSRKFSDGSAGAFSIAQFQRRESAHAISLRRSRNFLFPVSDELDSGAGIFDNCRRCCRTSADSAAVCSFALVRRPRRALRGKDAACHRPARCRTRLRPLRHPGCGSKLLAKFLSRRSSFSASECR